MLGFRRLDVYRCSVHFVAEAGSLVRRWPSGSAYLRDQLRRAALSVPLNIAEGSGRGMASDADAQRFYTIARGSALECAALIDSLEALAILDVDAATVANAKIERIVAMLTKMLTPSNRLR